MRVIVVGAGLAGLTCARLLGEGDAKVAGFETSDDVLYRRGVDSGERASQEVLG